MLSMQNFGLLLLNMLLYTLLTVGVFACAARLFGVMRRGFCDCRNRDVLAAIATGVIIIVSLMLFPQPGMMDLPFVNVLPMVIFVIYTVSGAVHLWLWRKPLLNMLDGVISEPSCSEARCCCEGECSCRSRCHPCGCSAERECSCGTDRPEHRS